MLLKTADSHHIIHTLDRVLMDLVQSIRVPSVYKAGVWHIKVASPEGH